MHGSYCIVHFFFNMTKSIVFKLSKLLLFSKDPFLQTIYNYQHLVIDF